MKNKIKVVWLCSFSDRKIRKNLKFPKWYWGNVVRKMMGMRFDIDFAVWDSNAIAEYEKLGGIELHVVAAHCGNGNIQEFEENGIYYHVVWSEYDVIVEKIKRKLNKRDLNSFPHFRKNIARIIHKINPDIVHVIGIENKFHSMAVLDLPVNIPVIAQLQTLVSDERFKASAGETEQEYQYNSDIEKRIMQRANYIGTTVLRFREIITADIMPNAVFVDTTLPLTEKVNIEQNEKKYDFVYFSANINKAADWAIEAFILAAKKQPNITLDIIGGYDETYKSFLENRLKENDLLKNVTFEGKLPTHDDVIKHIRLSRFALIPLKIDIVSGTIREAMANGLPVVTTVTPGTPELNKKMECVLLSAPKDFNAMAENMLELMNNKIHADTLRQNALHLANERESNSNIIKGWLSTYHDIVEK